jgi:hypothetical protein
MMDRRVLPRVLVVGMLMALTISYSFQPCEAQLNDIFITVFNMLNADLSRSTSNLVGGQLSQDTCGGILDEYGSCNTVIAPDFSGINVTYLALWQGLGNSPFGFKLTVDPDSYDTAPSVHLLNSNEPLVYVNSTSASSGFEATVCVAFCRQAKCPYCF